jgi:hypothetical protein
VDASTNQRKEHINTPEKMQIALALSSAEHTATTGLYRVKKFRCSAPSNAINILIFLIIIYLAGCTMFSHLPAPV